MALTKRVEVLFDPEHYRVIEQLARSQGKTVGGPWCGTRFSKSIWRRRWSSGGPLCKGYLANAAT